MSSSPPTSPDVSDTAKEAEPLNADDNDSGEVTLNTLVRESADGGSTQSLRSNSQDGGCSDAEREDFQNGSEKEKEKQNVSPDLDKDIDAMVEYNVRNGQVDPNASLNITNIPVDSTLDSSLNMNADGGRSLDETDTDGMKDNLEMTKSVVETDVNGNHQQLDMVSEKSFTSDTSSAVAETVVKNVLEKAVEAVRSREADGMEEEPDKTQNEFNVPVTDSGDVKVGLFQYYRYGNDESDKEESEEDDNDTVVTKEPENDKVKESDIKVGLFQYYDDADADRVRSPEVSEMEDEVVEDQLDSITDEEKQNILKMYGLETVDAISPKSASPTESWPTGESVEENDMEKIPILDVQREIYEPQTRQFSVNRDPSSNESTPRYESYKLDTEVFNEKDKFETDKQPEDMDNDVQNEKNKDEERKPSSDNKVEATEMDANDEQFLCGGGPIPEISPPLIKYESIKDNGKFRIVKTPKEGGGSSYSTIRVGTDALTQSQSPRESSSEVSQGSGSEKGSPLELSPRSQSGSKTKDTERDNTEIQSATRPVISDLETGREMADMEPTHDNSHIDRLRQSAEIENELTRAKTSYKTMVESTPQENDISSSTSSAYQPQSSNQSVNVPELHALPRKSAQGARVTATNERDVTQVNRDRTEPGRERTRSEQERTTSELRRISNDRESAKYRSERSQYEEAGSYMKRDGNQDVEDRTQAEMRTSISRIKYMTRDTDGREISRTGPVPYEATAYTDPLASDSRYLEVQDGQYGRQYDNDRYLSERLNRQPEGVRETDQAGQFSSAYQKDLIHSAYSRVAQKTREQTSRNTEQTFSRSASRTLDTGVIPGFKTLQEQQVSWSSTFNTLEEEHRRELRSQYERHQYNIQRLQQQMELELQKQHHAIRKKLDIHKEALVQMSPERENQTAPRRYRSPDRSLSPERHHRSPDRSNDIVERLRERSRERSESYATDVTNDMSTLQNSFDTKTWREIYKEVREEEEKHDPTPPQPLKRSLDHDFANLEGSFDMPRSSTKRPSPHGRSAEKMSRSGEMNRTNETSEDNNFERSRSERVNRDCSLERIRPLEEGVRHLEEGFSRSLERESSKLVEKDSRSRTKKSLRESMSPRSPRDGTDVDTSTGNRVVRRDDVSPHVQELLDNLKDTRTSLRGIQGDVGSERPRAGVYSSPMPMIRGKGTKSTSKSPCDASVSFDTSRASRTADHSRISLPGDHAEFHDDRHHFVDDRDKRDRDVTKDTSRNDDIYMSPSGRINLREKHSKHLSDLRAYYEDELRELRKALTDSLESTTAGSADMSMQSNVQSHLLEAENKHLLDKCRTMEDEIDELYSKIRSVEQKNQGVEKRASEYAAAFADSQAMGIQHRAHIEELQRYCRERDDLVNDLESKVRSQEDSVKIYKKNLDNEMELHRQDKIALQRIVDKYDSVEREFKLLQETMNQTENKLYETRTEVVELNRTISKLELENKRLGRENDNLRHKVTQSLNLSSLHESFGSPSSPRGTTAKAQTSTIQPQSLAPSFNQSSSTESRPQSTDARLPGFSTSMKDWTPSTQKSRPKTTSSSKTRSMVTEILQTSSRHDSSDSSDAHKVKRDSTRHGRKEVEESTKGNHSGGKPSGNKSREEVPRRSQKCTRDVDQEPTRDITPPRPSSANSQQESEVGDYSPLLKAERELYKLRDMMRQAVAVKPSSSPPQPKIQKKFYGSERPSSKDDYTPDFGTARGKKEKPSTSNYASVVKTKANQSHSKSDKTMDKSGKKSEKKSRERGSSRNQDKRDQDRSVERDRKEARTPTKKNCAVNPDIYASPTRFDIDINEEKKTVTVSQKKVDTQSGKQKNLFTSEAGDHSRTEAPQTNGIAVNGESKGAEGQVENTLDMMRHKQYTSRPQWEDVYTSLAKPKPESQDKVKNMEETIKNKMRNLSEMESRYDGLQAEKRQLESSLTKIPLHGRVDRNNRRHKEELEDRLDLVEKELGSLRMSLKRYNVLKTAG